MTAARIIVYGYGATGRMAARYAAEKGATIAAIYMRTLEGKDFSSPWLEGAEICTPDVPFEKHGADVLLSTHCSKIADLYEPAARAARAGLDVLTIAEHAFEPFYQDHEIARCHELDALFRSHNKTMVSVGVQDTFWYSQPMTFLSAGQKVDRLVGRNTADLSLFGYASTPAPYIGITPEAYMQGGYNVTANERGTFEVALRPLIRSLGLGIRSLTREFRPVLAEEDIDLPQFGIHIAKGLTRGRAEVASFELENGMIVEGEFHRCYMHKGETPYNEWQVFGTPTMNMRTDNFHGDVITAASLVNRIPDVLAARAGFLSVSDLPTARYYDAF